MHRYLRAQCVSTGQPYHTSYAVLVWDARMQRFSGAILRRDIPASHQRQAKIQSRCSQSICVRIFGATCHDCVAQAVAKRMHASYSSTMPRDRRPLRAKFITYSTSDAISLNSSRRDEQCRPYLQHGSNMSADYVRVKGYRLDGSRNDGVALRARSRLVHLCDDRMCAHRCETHYKKNSLGIYAGIDIVWLVASWGLGSSIMTVNVAW